MCGVTGFLPSPWCHAANADFMCQGMRHVSVARASPIAARSICAKGAGGECIFSSGRRCLDPSELLLAIPAVFQFFPLGNGGGVCGGLELFGPPTSPG